MNYDTTIEDLVNALCEEQGIVLWKDIPGYEGMYQVSNVGGMVRSMERTVQFGKQKRTIKEHLLKKHVKGTCQYPQVNLSIGGKQHWVTVHKLVCQVWVPNPNNLPQVNHLDEDINNANAANLEWCDMKHNNNWGGHNKRGSETKKQRYAEGTIKIKTHTRPVAQYTKDGQYVATYNSIVEAAKAVGCVDSNIIFALKGETKTACGYVWHYITEKIVKSDATGLAR